MKTFNLSVKDVAKRLGLSSDEIYKMAEKREITHIRTHANLSQRVLNGKTQTFRITGRIRFAEEDVQAWIDAHKVTAVNVPTPTAAPATTLEPLPMPAVRRFGR